MNPKLPRRGGRSGGDFNWPSGVPKLGERLASVLDCLPQPVIPRRDVAYEHLHGHKLDRRLLKLLLEH